MKSDLAVAAVREPIRAEQQCHVTKPVKVHVNSAQLSQPVQPCATCAGRLSNVCGKVLSTMLLPVKNSFKMNEISPENIQSETNEEHNPTADEKINTNIQMVM